MTNEDVIDLFNRVKMGSIVVVLAPKSGNSPTNPRVATQATRVSTDALRGLGAASDASPTPLLF